jgi:plasmid stabilization system protein ParE
MNVRYFKRYQRDLNALLTYVASDDDAVADAMARSIRDTISRCAIQPLIGSHTNEHGVFRYPIKRYR